MKHAQAIAALRELAENIEFHANEGSFVLHERAAQYRAAADALERLPSMTLAVSYVLDRAENEPDRLGYHLSPFTEAWARLVEAEAFAVGRAPHLHRAWRRSSVERQIVEAWESYDRGERATLLVRTADAGGIGEVAVGLRCGPWVVTECDDDGYSVTHGPSGLAVPQARGSIERLEGLARLLHDAAPDFDPSNPCDASTVRVSLEAWLDGALC